VIFNSREVETVIEKICPVCGKPFIVHHNKTYCSIKCKNKYNNSKNKKRKSRVKNKKQESKLLELEAKARSQGVSYGQLKAAEYAKKYAKVEI